MRDELLLRRAVRGDAAAFGKLIGEQQGRIYAVCLRLLTDRQEAEDCAQEAILRCWRGISGFKGDSEFGTWAYRIAVNTATDALRRRRDRGASLDALREEGFEPADRGPDPQQRLESTQRKERLAEGIAALPEEMRSALVLRDVEGHAYEEIAQMLDLPPGTVRSRISRARAKLCEYLLGDRELFSGFRVKDRERGQRDGL